MANRIDRGSASKGSGSRKGRTHRRRSPSGPSKHRKGAARKGGPRTNKGWSGPAGGTRQVRGSNAAPASRGSGTAKRTKAEGPSHPSGRHSRAQSERASPTPKGSKGNQEARDPSDDGQASPRATVEEEVQGPIKVEDLKTRADKMVVGERTVIHHAAKYGIVRGMTWTVILSALLFWLPIAGPAAAGYVGGRKAGGPMRGLIAVIIPAICMFVLIAALSEGLAVMPTSVSSVTEVDVSTVAGVPGSAVPIIGSVQASLEAWVSSPPDVVFIMLVFAMVGGALSSLRRREEETVIEKVGIPLGELKERILQEEAEEAGGQPVQPPSRWHPHRVIAAPVAAHDAFNESVEHLVHQVVLYMQEAGMLLEPDGSATATPPSRRRRRRRQAISTGGEGPHYDELVSVSGPPYPLEAAAEPAVQSGPQRSTTGVARARGRRRGTTAAPRHVSEAIVGDEGDWEVVDTSKGRRPVRVVRPPPQDDVRTVAPMVASRMVPAEVPTYEPIMRVEEEPRGIFRRSKPKVVYGNIRTLPDDGPEAAPPPRVTWEAAPSAHGVTGAAPVDDGADAPPTPRRRRANFERLPIVGPIMAGVGHGDADGTIRQGSIRSLDGPSVQDTLEAGNIAESAARELVEMARFEEGPDLGPEGELVGKPGSDEMTEGALEEVAERPRAKASRKGSPAHLPRPKAKSTARKVKHPTGALKSRSREHDGEGSFDEGNAMVGVVVWEGPEGAEVEEEDLFSPRRLEDSEEEPAPDPDDGPKEGSDTWLEEERIAALVREREDWDRL